MNIYTENGMREVINASGRMTKLGVSTVSEEVGNTLLEAAGNYILVDELFAWAGKTIGAYIGCEDACVTASASSGIALAVASLLCGDDVQKIQRFQETVAHSQKREVILLKGHNVDFGAPIATMIEAGGGKVVEVGYANGSKIEDITHAISEQTLAIFFVKSHHCVQKNMVDVETVIKTANALHIPCIVDAAAEEDLSRYVQLGADFVCYSGAKAISGPTSGFVACAHAKDAQNMRLQYKGIGRLMKIGKENTMGLVKAIEIYQKNHGYVPVVQRKDMERFTAQVSELPGLQAEVIQDEAGREIYRTKITVDEKRYGMSALSLVKALEQHDPAIYTRDYQANIGSIAIDPRPLKAKDELQIIYEVLKQIGEKHRK